MTEIVWQADPATWRLEVECESCLSVLRAAAGDLVPMRAHLREGLVVVCPVCQAPVWVCGLSGHELTVGGKKAGWRVPPAILRARGDLIRAEQDRWRVEDEAKWEARQRDRRWERT